MKVYIVTTPITYDDFFDIILGVFSTKEKAEEFIKKYKADKEEIWDIFDIELDKDF